MSLTVGRDGGFSKLGSWYSPGSGIRVSRDQIASPQRQRSGRSDVFTMRHLIAATFRNGTGGPIQFPDRLPFLISPTAASKNCLLENKK
jgi:hypothetical protein